MTHVAIDPAAAYAAAVRTTLPHATLVVDHFHLVQVANTMVTDVRRRVSQDSRGRRGRAVDGEWVHRRRLLSAHERLRPASFVRMWNRCLEADPSCQIPTAWIIKEELRKLLMLHAHGRGRDRNLIGHRLWRFYTWCADSQLPRRTAWRPPSRPGGRPSRRSWKLGSATPRQRARTGSPRRSCYASDLTVRRTTAFWTSVNTQSGTTTRFVGEVRRIKPPRPQRVGPPRRPGR